MEYVYVITHPSFAGYVKVGKTTSLRSRLSAYQTGDPLKRYAYAATFAVPDADTAEARSHRLLRGYRVGTTEWFRLAAADAIELLKDIA